MVAARRPARCASLAKGLGNRRMQAPLQDDEASSVNWSSMYAHLSQVATDRALDLPPLQEDIGFLRQAQVMATLCHYTYSFKLQDVGSTSNIELRLAGLLHDTATVSVSLLHFREAEIGRDMEEPQQYGVWSVSGLGLVIAFRGTASSEDVFIDANIRPVPLTSAEQQDESGVFVHHGFYLGARQHADAIIRVIQQAHQQAGHCLPVWVTGHSLGGAYANCVMLHLLESRSTSQLFQAGGGCVTFGAPMVLYSTDRAALYQKLAQLEEAAEARHPATPLHFHNFVNNADLVPRLLGKSLDSVHAAVEYYIPSMKAVRATARNYHPFGQYHIVHGSSIRSIALPNREREVMSRIGDAAYGEEVDKQLDATRIWKSLYGTKGKGAGMTHHSVMSYQERLATYIEKLARSSSRNLSTSLDHYQEQASRNMTSLFAPPPMPESQGLNGGLDRAALDDMGNALGGAAQAAATHLASSALSWWKGDGSNANRPVGSSVQRRASQGASVGGVSGGQQPSRWFTASRWTVEPSEPPPATWRELGGALGNSLVSYMQNSPPDPSQPTDNHETEHS